MDKNMKQERNFLRMVCSLAIPVALQSMLQASFSIIDQIMIGQLGSVSVAGIGLAGKFASIYTVMISAIGAVAGIMISQYMGQNNKKEIKRSFYLNLLIALGIAVLFTAFCVGFPEKIMSLYIKDEQTVRAAAGYLNIIAWTFLPVAGTTLLSTMLRCMEKAFFPLYASIAAAILNTGLNYALIFGKFGFPAMGIRGAAIATLIAQLANLGVMVIIILRNGELLQKSRKEEIISKFHAKQYVEMLFPILICEFMWSLGENVYAAIYGHLGTQASAAMTLINPIQGLMIGALCGLSQAAGVIIGKKLGNREYEDAYESAKKLILYGFVGSAVLSVAVIMTSAYYVEIYQVTDSVKALTRQILVAYAFIAPFKVQNMIVGGGIIRSGGKTKYVMLIDLIGTWVFGVPLGLFSAFVLKLPIPYVYFILSLEECVRFGISIVVLRRRKWMQNLEAVSE